MCACDDFDPPSFYQARDVRARKPHRCFECHLTIQPGEHYRRVSGKWEGEVSTWHLCLPCAVLSEWVQREEGCVCLEMVQETARELVRSMEDDAAWKARRPTSPVDL